MFSRLTCLIYSTKKHGVIVLQKYQSAAVELK